LLDSTGDGAADGEEGYVDIVGDESAARVLVESFGRMGRRHTLIYQCMSYQ
jgi:hypothetical protein